MISAFGKHGQIEKIAFYLEEMERNSIELDIKTYNLLISLYGRNGDVENAVLYLKMKLNGIEPDVSTFSSLMNAYANICLETVCTYFSEMKKMNLKPNVVVYTILISAHGAASQHEKIDGLLQEMKRGGNRTTDSVVSSMCWIKTYDGLRLPNSMSTIIFLCPRKWKMTPLVLALGLFNNEDMSRRSSPPWLLNRKARLKILIFVNIRNTIPHLISKSVARQEF